MSEVKRISVFIHGPNKEVDMVEAAHLDRVTAERDAERRRADVAVADANAADAAGKKVSELLSNRTAERDALQARQTAADERADVLEGLLRKWLSQFPKPGITGGPITTLKEETAKALSAKESGSHA